MMQRSTLYEFPATMHAHALPADSSRDEQCRRACHNNTNCVNAQKYRERGGGVA